MNAQTPAAQAFREGRLLDCQEILGRSSSHSTYEAVLAAEVLALLGRTDEAETAAHTLLHTRGITESLEARCTSVLADCRWYRGERDAALELYQLAVQRSNAAKDASIVCRASTQLLERTCDRTGFDSSLPLASVVRRAVTRSGDPHDHSLVHLAFGRLEGKVGRVAVAQRHFALARGLLTGDANAYLSSSIDLDESVVLWLTGDIDSAIDLAERGAALAFRIGWSRGCVAAGANLACLYVCSGRLKEAHERIQQATHESFSSPSFKLALTDTRVRALLASGEYAAAEAILEANQLELQGQPWYELTFRQTQVELLRRMNRWPEALAKLSTCIESAREAKLQTLLTGFQLAQAEILVESEGHTDLTNLPLTETHAGWPLGLIGGFHSAIGKALSASDEEARGRSHKARAVRIFEGAGDLMAAKRIREGAEDGGTLHPIYWK